MIRSLLTINGLVNVRVEAIPPVVPEIPLYVVLKRDAPYALCVAFEFDLNGTKVLALTGTRNEVEAWKANPAKLRASYDNTVGTFANAADIMAQLHQGVNIHPWIIAGLVAGKWPGAEEAARAWTAARGRDRDARHAAIEAHRREAAAKEAAQYAAAKAAFMSGSADVAGSDVYRMAREYVPALHPRALGALRKLSKVRYEDPRIFNMTVRAAARKPSSATFSSISRTLWQVRDAMTKAGVTKAGVTAGH